MNKNNTFMSLLLIGFVFCPIALPMVCVTPAKAQYQVAEEYRIALEPYGSWQRSRRWGDVWIPTQIRQDWSPYTLGHWVYTSDYGWYWASAPEENGWGLITFHYGHWV